jgi:hypothetical protein
MRSFGPGSPSRGGKHAVSVEVRPAATQFWPCWFNPPRSGVYSIVRMKQLASLENLGGTEK